MSSELFWAIFGFHKRLGWKLKHNNNNLTISHVKPHRSVTRATISHWILSLLLKKQASIPQYLKLTPWEKLLLQHQPMLWFLSKKFWIWQTGPRLQLFVRFITNLFFPPLLERLYIHSFITITYCCVITWLNYSATYVSVWCWTLLFVDQTEEGGYGPPKAKFKRLD